MQNEYENGEMKLVYIVMQARRKKWYAIDDKVEVNWQASENEIEDTICRTISRRHSIVGSICLNMSVQYRHRKLYNFMQKI